jgi:cytochrome bd ubiquinol oxidase subunit II
METFWFIVLMITLTAFVLLDGFDFGAGIVHLLFAKEGEERDAVVRSIGPFWDANEVWLIAGGGVLFFAFPIFYAAAFSGFYLPLMLILWLLIFRAIGLEMRHFWQHPLWDAIWNRAFGISSLLLALFLGLALGNVVRGVNLGGVEDGVSRWEPQYFFLPLWDGSFSPLGTNPGIVDWFTVVLGLVTLVTLTIHGAGWVMYKTASSLNIRLKRLVPWLAGALLVLVPVSVMAWVYVRPEGLANYASMPVLWLFPGLAVCCLVGLVFSGRFVHEGRVFLFSSLFIGLSALSTAISLYPVLLPNRNGVHADLTIFNCSAEAYGLRAGMGWWPFAAVLVGIYLVVQFRAFRGKL